MNLAPREPEMNQLANVESFEELDGIRLSTRVVEIEEKVGTQPQTNNVISNLALNFFDRLPDELIERVMNFVGIVSTSTSISLDPYEAGWKDQEELARIATSFGHSIANLRLVCLRFFHIATPLFFKRLVICESDWKRARQPTRFILRLSNLLSTSRPTTNAQVIPVSTFPHALRDARCHRAHTPPYGHYVKQLIISSGAIPPLLYSRLIDMIHSLIPNVTTLSGLNLSYMPFLFSPIIRFPRLVSITGIDIAPYSDAWRGGYPAINNSLNLAPILGGRSNDISQEIFLGILNNHPQTSHLACRGLQIDESGARRLLALLRTNQLSISLLPPYLRSQTFVGLQSLHIGINSVIDLHLIRSLPSVAPHLQQLHLDAGCQIMDKTAGSSQPWSLAQLFHELPRLTHFTFIAQHCLPNRQGSIEWASSNKFISISPLIQSLNIRIDSITSAGFFDGLVDTKSLRKLNVWHRPVLSTVPESWSIISFESFREVVKLGHHVQTMKKAGLEWPKVEDQQRDLWMKLKALGQMEIPDISDSTNLLGR